MVSLDEKSHCLTKSRYLGCFRCTADVLNGPPLSLTSQPDILTIQEAHWGVLVTSRSPQVWCTVLENFFSTALSTLDFFCITENNTVNANSMI